MLAVCRGVQGVGGGGIMQLVQISISDIVPLAERPKYMGALGSLWGVSSVLGPLIGTSTHHPLCIWVEVNVREESGGYWMGIDRGISGAYRWSLYGSCYVALVSQCDIRPPTNKSRRSLIISYDRAFWINLPTGGIAMFLILFLKVRCDQSASIRDQMLRILYVLSSDSLAEPSGEQTTLVSPQDHRFRGPIHHCIWSRASSGWI